MGCRIKNVGLLLSDRDRIVGHRIETDPVEAISESSGLPIQSLEEWYGSAVAMGALTSPSVIKEGRLLADVRAKCLTALIRDDPEAAIQEMLPLTVYADLPQDIRERIEQPFAAAGDVVVIPKCRDPKPLIPNSTNPGELYFATWDGETRQMFLPRVDGGFCRNGVPRLRVFCWEISRR